MLKTLSSTAKLCAAALAAVVLFCACAKPENVALPPEINPYEVPLRSVSRVSLSFLDTAKSTEDVTVFASEIRELTLPNAAMPERAAVEALLGPSTSFGSVSGKDWKCNSVDIVQGNAFIDISMPQGDDGAMLPIFRTACIMTLSQLRGVSYVHLTVDGQLPSQFETTSLEGSTVTETAADTRPVILYYPDKQEQYILPVAKSIHIEQDKIAYAIFNALKQSGETTGLIDAYPESVMLTGLESAASDASITVWLECDIWLSEEQLRVRNASFALSLLHSLPNKSNVVIHCQSLGKTQIQVFTAQDLLALRGGLVQLYFPGQANDALTRVYRAVPFQQAANPFTCVSETLDGLQSKEGDTLSNVAPDNVGPTDFLNYTIYSDLVVISLSGNFYQSCEKLGESQELFLVYSLVNALTDNGGINRVLFVKDGVNVETLAGRIVLSQPLLRNPGLIRQ